MAQIAAEAGVARATVSYALRGSFKIPAKTAAMVRATAERLGYRPNPRVTALMAHIRGSRSVPAEERIAFVWVHTSRAEARQNAFLKLVFAGTRERAGQMGFALEEFWTSDPGMTNRRLEQILRARGIVGVVLSPVTTAESAVALDWDWRQFAPAVIGNVTWTPELHHAGHHHFLAMRLALIELAKLGCKRPVALIEATVHERNKHASVAGFLAHHPQAASARGLVRVVTRGAAADLGPWLRAARPDALIVSHTDLFDLRGVEVAAKELRVERVTLNWTKGTPHGIGGVDACHDRVAGHAVDLVAAQLNANETGAPDFPRMMLFPGRWVAPAVVRKERAGGGK